MSNMKTVARAKVKTKPRRSAALLPSVFTVRDLSRQAATVLKACRQHGSVTVRTRGGEQFTVQPAEAKPEPGSVPDYAGRHRRLLALGCRQGTRADAERIHAIIAGE